MKWMGNTISEYYILQGEERGRLEGQLINLEFMLAEGKIDQAYFDTASAKLKGDLAQLGKAAKAKRRPAAKVRPKMGE